MTPRNGVAGSVWRGVTTPARLAAPFAHLARRAAAGRYWVELQRDRDHAAPVVRTDGQSSDATSVEDGTGPAFVRRYEIEILGAAMSATELVDHFVRHPNDFSPTSYATFVPDPGPNGWQVGDEAEVKLPGPWNGPVTVAERTPRSVTLHTRHGHMEAGVIRFSADDHDGSLVFRIDSTARSASATVDVLYRRLRLAKLIQSQMWAQVLEAAAKIAGGTQRGRIVMETTQFNDASS